MVSRTAFEALVCGHDAGLVRSALANDRALSKWRNPRGYGWLHTCCGVDVRKPGRSADASIATAQALLDAGLDIDEAAFVEGDWKATPLWCAVARGRNLALAEWLLEHGCNPNYCLYAAGFNDDMDAIRLLVRHGALVDDRSAEETPFLAAVSSSHFAAAELLLQLGADPDTRAADGRTAVHMMLAKGSKVGWIIRFVELGAGLDIADAAGVTARAILAGKRDGELRELARQR